MKNFSDKLASARNTVAETALLTQHDEFMENEVLKEATQETATPEETTQAMEQILVADTQTGVQTQKPLTRNAKPKEPIANVHSQEKTKGIVVDVPWSLYCQLRDIKDERPNESLKSLALQAIAEYVQRETRKMQR